LFGFLQRITPTTSDSTRGFFEYDYEDVTPAYTTTTTTTTTTRRPKVRVIIIGKKVNKTP
jgi:hypothetical protein